MEHVLKLHPDMTPLVIRFGSDGLIETGGPETPYPDENLNSGLFTVFARRLPQDKWHLVPDMRLDAYSFCEKVCNHIKEVTGLKDFSLNQVLAANCTLFSHYRFYPEHTISSWVDEFEVSDPREAFERAAESSGLTLEQLDDLLRFFRTKNSEVFLPTGARLRNLHRIIFDSKSPKALAHLLTISSNVLHPLSWIADDPRFDELIERYCRYVDTRVPKWAFGSIFSKSRSFETALAWAFQQYVSMELEPYDHAFFKTLRRCRIVPIGSTSELYKSFLRTGWFVRSFGFCSQPSTYGIHHAFEVWENNKLQGYLYTSRSWKKVEYDLVNKEDILPYLKSVVSRIVSSERILFMLS
ncbi:MAG: hypothetical protein D6698_01510 [Gammaproteobacteria bacterium]|nr:MAG: hypothetical protein D6698_01510 [Gammaproteobacteria bacterium]